MTWFQVSALEWKLLPKGWLLVFFVNKILALHSNSHSLTYYIWLLSSSTELNHFQRDLISYKLKESEVAQSCRTPCDPMDCSPPGSSIHGFFQARILEWVAISFYRRSSRPRDWTGVSHIVGRRFTILATGEVHPTNSKHLLFAFFRKSLSTVISSYSYQGGDISIRQRKQWSRLESSRTLILMYFNFCQRH